jgi:hypothetical protein
MDKSNFERNGISLTLMICMLSSEYLKKVIVDFLLGWQKSPPIAAYPNPSVSHSQLTHSSVFAKMCLFTTEIKEGCTQRKQDNSGY